VLTNSSQTKYIFDSRQRLERLKGIKLGRNDIRTGTNKWKLEKTDIRHVS